MKTLPRLSLAYGHVERWMPRQTDGRNVSQCPNCHTEYIDDFPNGGPLRSPCCPQVHMNRATRLTRKEDLPLDAMERLGWKVIPDAGVPGERDANARASGE